MNGDQSAIKLPVTLAAYEVTVSSLLSSFTASQFNPETTHSAFEALLEADKALNEALDEADLHNAQHYRILSLQHQSRSLSTQISSALRTLSTARQTLQHLPTSLAPISTPSTITKVDAQTLLSYAAKIAPFTGAPSAELPWPDETKLRVGVLGMGPEAGSLARQSAIEEFQEKERRKVEEASQPPVEVKEVVNDVHMEDQHNHEHGEEEEGEDLGLDLFDPDAE
ncbi:hypothetical protein YB2330_003547 [Saitoella coloradoensis]